jgi:FkbM family methyltransferase
MLLDLPLLTRAFDLHPSSVLHVGAHSAEEAPLYEQLGVGEVFWVEANPALLEQLRRVAATPGHTVIGALVDDQPRLEVPFHVTTSSQASSLLPLGTARRHHPEIEPETTITLTTTTLDELGRTSDFSRVDMLNLDIQGAELRALRGAGSLLPQVDLVYSEVNREEVYEGCGMVWEIDELLAGYGLVRVRTHWGSAGWGDALYVRGGVGVGRRARASLATTLKNSRQAAERSAAARTLARALGRGGS